MSTSGNSLIFLFDIDGTVFDTARVFKDQTQPALQQQLGLNRKDFIQIQQSYFNSVSDETKFSMQDYLAAFVSACGLSYSAAEQLEQTFRKTFFSSALYPEVLATLTTLRERGYQLGVFSQGVLAWQQLKLELTLLHKYVSPELTFISSDKCAADFLSRLPYSTVVDNKLMVAQAVATCDHLRSVWIDRGEERASYTSTQLASEKIQRIEHLTELLSLGEQRNQD